MAADVSWAAPAAALGTALGAGIVAIWQGRKTKADGGEATVAGALVDSRSIKALTQAIEDASALYHKDAARIVDATEDYGRALRDNSEATRAQTDASINITRFLEGRSK